MVAHISIKINKKTGGDLLPPADVLITFTSFPGKTDS